MKIDFLILQLAIIFLPGIIWASLDAGYAAKIKPSEGQFLLRTFLFGTVIYATEFIIFKALHLSFHIAELADASSHEIVSRDVLVEVLCAIPISGVLALVWLYASRFKVLTRALQFIGATNKYGDEDVWDFTLNSGDAAVEYAHVRDFEHQYVYAGWVNVFSETDRVRELVLREVVVYDFEGQELYRTPRLYLALPPDAIHIEFPYEPAHPVKDSRT